MDILLYRFKRFFEKLRFAVFGRPRFLILGAVLLLIVMPALVMGAREKSRLSSQAAITEAMPVNVTTTPLSRGFSVSWTSENRSGQLVEARGFIYLRETIVDSPITAYDDQGANIVSADHQVTVNNLTPNATYYIKIVSGKTTYGRDPVDPSKSLKAGADWEIIALP
ncbi:MAG: fibronectin type III domain-containing protein [bacterium]|nr:fibronectin type III domain-containing protein [bacterium]